VHFTGEMPDMAELTRIAQKHHLPIVEDACQAILAECDGRRAGSWGIAAGFSLHPLKNLNVWGDGGIAVTNDDSVAARLRLLRNHGLANRDEIELLGYNSRLDSLQAVVGNWLIPQTEDITAKRIDNAAHYDRGLGEIRGVRIPSRSNRIKRVYHLYMIFAEERDALHRHCLDAGISAKVHYPIPVYRQRGLSHFGHKQGDFPVTDRQANQVLSFPVDQHLSREEQDHVIETVREFYARRR